MFLLSSVAWNCSVFYEAILSVTETSISFQDKHCQNHIYWVYHQMINICVCCSYYLCSYTKSKLKNLAQFPKHQTNHTKTNRRQFLTATSYTDKMWVCFWCLAKQTNGGKKKVSFILMQFYPCIKFIIISTQLFPMRINATTDEGGDYEKRGKSIQCVPPLYTTINVMLILSDSFPKCVSVF